MFSLIKRSAINTPRPTIDQTLPNTALFVHLNRLPQHVIEAISHFVKPAQNHQKHQNLANIKHIKAFQW